MSFWKKLANVATGGMLGMAQGIKNRDFKAIASGGFLGGKKQPGRPLPGPAPSQEAQSFFATQSPEDQENIMRSFGIQGVLNNAYRPPQLEQWYQNAKAAGSVPAPQAAPQPGAVAPLMPGAGPAPAAPGIANMLATNFAAPAGMPAQQPQQPLMSYEDWKAAGRPNVPHEG